MGGCHSKPRSWWRFADWTRLGTSCSPPDYSASIESRSPSICVCRDRRGGKRCCALSRLSFYFCPKIQTYPAWSFWAHLRSVSSTRRGTATSYLFQAWADSASTHTLSCLQHRFQLWLKTTLCARWSSWRIFGLFWLAFGFFTLSSGSLVQDFT